MFDGLLWEQHTKARLYAPAPVSASAFAKDELRTKRLL